jgi:hypothetical protein
VRLLRDHLLVDRRPEARAEQHGRDDRDDQRRDKVQLPGDLKDNDDESSVDFDFIDLDPMSCKISFLHSVNSCNHL